MCALRLCCYEAKRPSLNLKTCPKQLLGSLPLSFALPSHCHYFAAMHWRHYILPNDLKHLNYCYSECYSSGTLMLSGIEIVVYAWLGEIKHLNDLTA